MRHFYREGDVDKLTAAAVMLDPEGRVERAGKIIEAIPEVIQSLVPPVVASASVEAGQVTVTAGTLDVFFRIVHGLPSTTFVQYGYSRRALNGDIDEFPVGEWPVVEELGVIETPRDFVGRQFFGAITETANAVADRYGPNVRILNGAVLEPANVKAPA